ncbi:hypothetical protein SCHPADRAFT_908946 [Schizopora paradoxa]|uniref:Uncharacterized protein n=1 Tax=Schizopora paradoxa TaxID=27342 RepID=A0A0H2R873_9AGAM|nr:hypothetical protein SCHPADRAFT_908946 [Schizopora paradoxa]
MNANAWPKFDGKLAGPSKPLEKRRRPSTDDLQAAGSAVKRRPIVSDFVDVTKGNGSPKPSTRDVARKPLFHGQRIDPALLLNKAKDAVQTPPRPKSTTLRPMDPPAFLPQRPGPQDASTSKSTSKPRSMRPPQPFNKAPTTSHTTPLTSRTFRLDRILPLAAKSTPSPARKVVPFNELPKPMPHFQSSTLKSPKTDLRVLSAPNLSLGARHKPSSLKSMSELNQPLTVDLEGELWGDNAEDVFGGSENRELMRGLLVSPEKPGTKGKKFLRGGLAERAQGFLSRSQTAYTLWQKDIEVQLHSIATRPNESSFISHRRALRPDLILRVESVLHETRISGTSRGSGSLRGILASCTMNEAAKDTFPPNPSGTNLNSLIVLFSFSPELHGGAAVTSSDPMFDMAEGTELFVWKPFHEVRLPGDGTGEDERALLCSRFLSISRTDTT